MMSNPPKLTKKQKKSLAFRERTIGKRHSKNGVIEMETTAVPVMEDQDIASMHRDTLEDMGSQKKRKEGNEKVRLPNQGRVTNKGKGEEKEKAEETEGEDVSVSVEVVKATKRKRTHEDQAREDQTSEPQSIKRKKGTSETKEKTAAKQRFILFVGSRLSCSLQWITIQSKFPRQFQVYDNSRSDSGPLCSLRSVLLVHYLFIYQSFFCRSSAYNPPAHTHFYFQVSTSQVQRMRILGIHSSQRTSTSSQTSPIDAGGAND
jgi:hypothetical protein